MAMSRCPPPKTITAIGDRSLLFGPGRRTAIQIPPATQPGRRCALRRRIRTTLPVTRSKAESAPKCSNRYLAPTGLAFRTVALNSLPEARAAIQHRCCAPIATSPKRPPRTRFRAFSLDSISGNRSKKERNTVEKSASAPPPTTSGLCPEARIEVSPVLAEWFVLYSRQITAPCKEVTSISRKHPPETLA